MRNYYEELKINSTDSVEAINKQLAQLESTWKRREITNPDKATTMLALIIEARKVFQNDATRADYDYKLKESLNAPSPSNDTNDAKMKKWKNEAKDYYDSEQYDLAKVAIDKALSYVGRDGEEPAIFALAAEIYKENNILSTAIDYINKAILLCPDISTYYMTKGFIYEKSAIVNSANGNYSKSQDNYRAECQQFKIAADKAKNNDDNNTFAKALGALSFILYFHLASPEDAEQYALEANKHGGDPFGNANRVLSDIQSKRDKAENERKEKIYSSAISDMKTAIKIADFEDVIEQLEGIIDYKDSLEQIEYCKVSIAEIEKQKEEKAKREEEERIVTERAKIKNRKIAKYSLITVSIITVISIIISTLIIPSGKYNEANKLIKDGKYEEAIAVYEDLNGFSDSKKKIDECKKELESISDSKYIQYLEYYNQGKYEEAILGFSELGEYKDSQNLVAYMQANNYYNNGEIAKAAVEFGKLGDYKDSEKISLGLWKKIIESRRKPVTVNNNDNDGSYIFAITKDGHVKMATDILNVSSKCDVSSWTNIVQVSAEAFYTAGLKSNGTVVIAARENEQENFDSISDWKDIVQISAAPEYVAGLKNDGTVIISENRWGDRIKKLKNIVCISAADSHLLALKNDGTVVTIGEGEGEYLQASNWNDIVSIDANYKISVGVRKDGTVVSCGDNNGNDYDSSLLSSWGNVTDCEANANIYALSSKKTVLQVLPYENDFYATNISKWTNINYFSAGLKIVVGVTESGNILVSGVNKEEHNIDISHLKNIRTVGNIY